MRSSDGDLRWGFALGLLHGRALVELGRLWRGAGGVRLFSCAVGPVGSPVNVLLELQGKKGKEQWECLEYKVFVNFGLSHSL